MASIQIHEIETPIEDLSDDVAGNITGSGFLGDQLEVFLRQLFLFVRETLQDCASGAIDPSVCDDIL